MAKTEVVSFFQIENKKPRHQCDWFHFFIKQAESAAVLDKTVSVHEQHLNMICIKHLREIIHLMNLKEEIRC